MASTMNSQEGSKMYSNFYWILLTKFSFNVIKSRHYGKESLRKLHTQNKNKNITNPHLLKNSHN